MQTEVDLAKCSFPKHLSNLVKLELGLWWFVVFLKAVLDKLLDQSYLF